MFASLLLALNVPLALTFALPPSNSEEQTVQLSPLDQLMPGKVRKDGIATSVNVSNALQIRCDGEKFGFNPDVTDCQDARSSYKRSSQLFTYGERHTGHPPDVFPLPFRLYGGKPLILSICSLANILKTRSLKLEADTGQCYLEPVLIDSSRTGTSSINHLSDAAYALILECAVRQSKGGVALGIGMSQTLKI